MREQLRSLNQQGVTIFLSSHILSDLEDICSRVAFIAAGRNAVGADGSSVLTLGAAAPQDVLTCEIEVVENPDAASAALAAFAGARLLDSRGYSLRAEVSGGSRRAAELLHHLVAGGVRVLRFDPRRAGLEDRYRNLFGGKPQ